MTTPSLQENTPPPRLLGLILAGGRSRRMGRDKATLSYHSGKTQIRHCRSLLSPYCERVYLSIRQERFDASDNGVLPEIPDQFGEIGPLGGLLSALTREPQAAWLVLACDLPLATFEAVETLVQARNPAKTATVWRTGKPDFYEPLFAIYEPAILPLLRDAVKVEQYSL